MRVTVNYVTITVNAVTEEAVENPFVYGEVVPAGAFVDRVDELKRLTADLLAGQKVFAPPLRQVVARLARAGWRVPSRLPHRRGYGQ